VLKFNQPDHVYDDRDDSEIEEHDEEVGEVAGKEASES
jgi:hypothetical protein